MQRKIDETQNQDTQRDRKKDKRMKRGETVNER